MELISKLKDSIDVLEEFRKAIIDTNNALDELIAGIHRSRMGGQNIEFLDYRDYVYGDDLRYVDWKVFLRSDKYFIKRFDDNKRNTVYLFVDSTSSMKLGEGRKNKYFRAMLLVAIITTIFLRMQDDVYIITNEDIMRVGESYGNPLLQSINHLFYDVSLSPSDLLDSYEKLLSFIKKNSVICIFSDLFSEPDRFIDYLKLASSMGVYQYVFHIVLKEEITPDIKGLRLFEDPDSEDKLILQADNIWNEYNHLLNRFISGINDVLTTTGAGKYILCDEEIDLRKIILSLLNK